MEDLRLAVLPRARWSRWRGASFAAHLAIVLAIWFSYAEPPLLQMQGTVAGNGPKDYRLVYLGPTGEDTLGSSEMPRLAVKSRTPAAPPRKPKTAQTDEPRKDAEFSSRMANAGSRFGSLEQGPYDGRDVRPAYPIVFPDPPIPHWLSASVSGDVVVEVTIDPQGNVTDYRLLQGVRDDINQKVITTVTNWRFNPATIDGVRVTSKEDMHFHFPS